MNFVWYNILGTIGVATIGDHLHPVTSCFRRKDFEATAFITRYSMPPELISLFGIGKYLWRKHAK